MTTGDEWKGADAESVPLEAGAQLYTITAKVRPLPGHPKFFDAQFGLLWLFLFANSVEDASRRAVLILRVLPYEVVGTKLRIGFGDWKGRIAPMYAEARSEAEQIGLAMRFVMMKPGEDEDWFEAMPLD